MFEKVFLLSRGTLQAGASKKDMAILRVKPTMGGQKMSTCAEWDGIGLDSKVVVEKEDSNVCALTVVKILSSRSKIKAVRFESRTPAVTRC